MREQKGITLIALVITIIVLLILAGVSIAMLTGENGILTKATQSTKETAKGEAVEAVKLAVSTVKADILDSTKNTTDKTYSELTLDTIVKAIKKSYPNSAARVEGTNIKFTASNNKVVTVPVAISNTGSTAATATAKIDEASVEVAD